MMHAYDSMYLDKTSRTIGSMLHDAVYEYQYDGSDFLNRFIQSGIAGHIEDGSPKYLAGRSGHELVLEIIEETTGKPLSPIYIETFERSDAYWSGWILARYQWYSGRTFRDILDTVSYDDLLALYSTLHEADVQKVYDVLDLHFAGSQSKLKTLRKICSLTQEELSEASGVPLSTIRAYERKAKDINKAQADILLKLARALKCDIKDLL